MRRLDACTRFAARAALCAGLLLGIAGAWAAAPAQYTTAYNGSTCAGCHGGPPPDMPPATDIVPHGAAATSGSDLRSIMSAIPAMTATVLADPALTDADLNVIRLYLIDVRDGTLAPASQNFGSAVATSTGSTTTFTITNERSVTASFAAAPSTSNGDFTIVGGGTCTPATVLASLGSCTVRVQFTPTTTGVRNGALRYTFDSPAGITAQQRSVALSGTGTSPLSINATTLDFGSVVATTTLTRSAIVRNLGGSSFQLSTFTFSGGSAALYTLAPTNACTPGLTLAAGAQCQLDVRFAPTTAGAGLNANLHITHTAVGTAAQDVTLLGSASPAPQGHIILSALSLAFPDTQLGSPAALPITVQNDGTAALNFSAFTLSGAAASDYTLGGTCSVGSALAIAATCTITVTFQPTVLGARPASLTIASDASNGPATIALSGNGVPVPAPLASLLPAPLDFGTQTVGGLYPARTVTLQNVGTAAMTVGTIAVSGTGFANAGSSSCPSTLAPGASCGIDIAFAPVAANTDYAGTLSVTTNAAGSPHTVALIGHGSAAAIPVLAWVGNPTSLDLGLGTAGTVSAPQTLTLINNGPGGTTIALVNAVGPDAAAFVVGGTCAGATLFQGQTCTVDVRFAPAFAGSRSAALQVASGGSPPPSLTVSGTGLAGPSPALALSVTTLTFDDTRVGAQSVPLEVALSGAGSGVVRVTALSVTGPYAMQTKTCPAVPFTLQVGGSCTVTVVFQPQAEGANAGTLSVTSDAVPATQDVALNGTGRHPADLSGGGCSLSERASLTDPTLWLLALLAALALAWRARRGRARP